MTALKTVSARIRSSKTDLEALGESTDDLAEGFSKYAKEIQAITGFNIMVEGTTNEFKDLYDIFDGLSKKWGELSDTQRSRVSEILGGVRQLQITSSILTNWGDAAGAYEDAMNSAGVTTKANDTYLESISAHLNQFKAGLQELSADIVDSGIANTFIDIGSGLLKFLDAIVEFADKSQVLRAAVVSAGGALVVNFGWPALKGIFSGIKILGEGFSALFGTLRKLPETVKAGTSALEALKMTFFAGGTKAAAAIGIVAVVTGLIWLIRGISNAYKQAHPSLEQLKEDMEESEATTNKLKDALQENIDKIEELRAVANGGKLSIVEQAEIDRLEQDNELLREQIRLEEKIQAEKQRSIVSKAREDAADFLNNSIGSESGSQSSGVIATEGIGGIKHYIDLYNVQRQYLNDAIEAGNDAAIESSRKMMIDALEGLQNIQTTANEIISNLDPEEDADLIKEIRDALQDIEQIYLGGETNYEKFLGIEGLNDIFGDSDGIEYTADTIEELANKFPALSAWLTQNGVGFDEAAIYATRYANALNGVEDAQDGVTKTQPFELSDALSSASSQLGIAKTADEEMASVGGISVDTVKSLADAVENYTEYLYIENGQIKINTDLLRENAVAGIQAQIDALNAETDALEKKNAKDREEYNAIRKSGVSRDEARSELNDLTNDLRENTVVINNNKEKIELLTTVLNMLSSAEEKAKESSDFVKGLEGVEALSDGFSQLLTVYKDIADGEEFDFSNIINNESFKNSFGELGDAYEDFMRIISNSPNDIERCQDAFDNLASAYLLNSDALENISADERDAIVAMLEYCGVANAAEIVDAALTAQKHELSLATADSIAETWAEINADLSLSGASDTARQALASLAYAKATANSATVNTSGDIENLYAMANAAGAATAVLANLARAKTLMAESEMYASMPGESFNAAYLAYQAQELVKNAGKVSYTPIKNYGGGSAVNYSGGGGGSGGGGSGGGSSSSDDVDNWFERQYAEHNHLINMDKENTADYLKWLEGAYKRAYDEQLITLEDTYKYAEEIYTGYQDLFKKYLDDAEYSIEILGKFDSNKEKILSSYTQLMSDIDDELGRAIAQGLDDTDEYIQELTKRWYDYAEARREIFSGSLEDVEHSISILSEFESNDTKIIGLYKDLIKSVENEIKVARTQGLTDDDDYIQSLQDKWVSYYSELESIFTDGLSDIEHEISLRSEFELEAKNIISLYDKLIKDVEAEIKAARDRGLGDNDEYIQSLQDKWNSYSKERKKIEDDITANAKSALDELVNYRVDMIKQEIDDEKSALDERLKNITDFYDKQKELLQDKYDEEKYLEEQAEKRSSVFDIEAQIAQLEFDDSAWAQKRRLELQEDLADAQKDLADFEREHAFDESINALEKSKAEQEAQIEAEMSALDDVLNNPHALYNQALDDIRSNTSKTLYDEMIEYNRKYGSGKDEDVDTMFEGAFKALTEYEKLNGKKYEGVSVQNVTGYTGTGSYASNVPKAGSGSSAGSTGGASVITSPTGSKVPTSSTPTKPSSSTPASNATPTTKSDPQTGKKESTAPQLSIGSHIQVKGGTKWYADSFGGGSWGYADGGTIKYINLSGTHPYNIDGLGWIRKEDIVGYATGTPGATPGLHSIFENGDEYIFTSPSSGKKYKMFSGGEKVLNSKATDFLYDFATAGSKILSNLFGGTVGSGSRLVKAFAGGIGDVRMGDIIINGNTDNKTVSEIRRAQRDGVEFLLKEFSRLQK